MELVERLRHLSSKMKDWGRPEYRTTCTEAADLLEEALKALSYYAENDHYDYGDVPGHIYVLDDHGRYARAILTKSQGEKIAAPTALGDTNAA